MPQICDMGQTALLPFRRKACLGFFSPEKIPRLRPGLNPRTWVPEASTLTSRPPKPLPNIIDTESYHRTQLSEILISQLLPVRTCSMWTILVLQKNFMWNTVTVQYNPLIEEEWDEHFKVTCEYGYDF